MGQLGRLSTLVNGSCVAINMHGEAVQVDEDFIPVVRRENKETGVEEPIRPDAGTYVRAFQGGGRLRVEEVTMQVGGFATKVLDLQEPSLVLAQLLAVADRVHITSQTE